MRLAVPLIALTGAAAVSLAASTVLAQERVSLVARVGLTLPGSGAETVTDLNPAFVAEDGSVGFVGTLSGSTTARFIYLGNSILFNSSSVTSPVLSGGEGTMGVSAAGGFAYSPSIDGGDGVYSHVGTLSRDGDPAPNTGGLFHVFGSRPRMAADGTAWWVGGTATTNTGTNTMDVLWSATTTGGTPAYTLRLKGGDTVSGVAIENTGLGFDYDISGNSSHYLMEVDLASGSTTNDAAIVMNGSIIAREGNAIGDGSGNNWQAFRTVSVNNDGDWLIYGDDNGTTNDDLLMFNGAVVARQGQTLDGITLGTTIDAAAINNLGQILQLWDLSSATDEGLFLGNSDNVSLSTLLLRVGDELDTDGDGDADYILSDFNASSTITHPLVLGDDGWVYLDVDLTTIGTTTVNQAIIGINTIPEPAALSLLGAGGLLLLRRRRGA